MMELDITFQDQPWERLIQTAKDGECISSAQLLTALESATEEQLEEALADMAQRHLMPDISDLPAMTVNDAAAKRLHMEELLVCQADMTAGLDKEDPLRLYLEELASIPVAGDPAVLALSIEEAGVREQLLNLLLNRAVESAKEFAGRGVLLLDLIQEASLGLWEGIGCYTEGDIYAHCDWWIRWQLSVAVLRNARSTGLGQKMRQAMEDYRSVDERLLSELGRNPLPEELAEALHISLSELETLATMVKNARKLDKVHTPEPEQLPQEEDQAVEDTAYFQMRQRIQELLSGLDSTDAQLLSLRYGLEGGLPMEPEQVGKKLGMTAQEVINREAAALCKLRQ